MGAVMLRSFQVANHRSLRDEQELVLLPAYDQSRQVVPVAAVFGANASGKSNLLGALDWMRLAVIQSYRLWEAEAGVPRMPFRLDLDAAAAPSSYVVDLLLDGVQYIYGFTVDDDVVLTEWLHAYPHQRERVIFSREGQKVELGSTVPERRSRADLLASLLRENSLLLSAAVQAGQEEVLPVHRWFREGLRFAGRNVWSGGMFVDDVAVAIDRFPSFVSLLKVADLGIADVIVDERMEAPSARDLDHAARLEARIAETSAAGSMNNVDRRRREIRRLREPKVTKELLFLHGDDGVPLGWADQSEGTLSWARLLMAALSALRDGATLLVDEVDASLHPRLTARLIELFRHDAVNENGAQLLFSTHDATLLGTNLGEEVLRRDEIWFVDKKDGVSTLYPLSDFHPRKGENRERRYLAGSYGAVPAIFVDSL
ncbi:MAG: ATP-binding protein, partial [Jiangellaceae bacterium]